MNQKYVKPQNDEKYGSNEIEKYSLNRCMARAKESEVCLNKQNLSRYSKYEQKKYRKSSRYDTSPASNSRGRYKGKYSTYHNPYKRNQYYPNRKYVKPFSEKHKNERRRKRVRQDYNESDSEGFE